MSVMTGRTSGKFFETQMCSDVVSAIHRRTSRCIKSSENVLARAGGLEEAAAADEGTEEGDATDTEEGDAAVEPFANICCNCS